MQYGGRKACDGEEKGILRMSVMLLSGVIPGRSASDVEAKCEVKILTYLFCKTEMRRARGCVQGCVFPFCVMSCA